MNVSLQEVQDVLKVAELRMNGHGLSHFEISDMISKIDLILKNEPSQKVTTCSGEKYCVCSSLAVKNGANRDTVEQIERDCPYREAGPFPGKIESNIVMMQRLLSEIPMAEWPKFLKYEESRLSHAAMTVLVYLRPEHVKVDFDKEKDMFKVQIGATGKELTVYNTALDVAFMDTIRGIMGLAFYKQPNEL